MDGGKGLKGNWSLMALKQDHYFGRERSGKVKEKKRIIIPNFFKELVIEIVSDPHTSQYCSILFSSMRKMGDFDSMSFFMLVIPQNRNLIFFSEIMSKQYELPVERSINRTYVPSQNKCILPLSD